MLLERSEIQIRSGAEEDFTKSMAEQGLPLLTGIPGVKSAAFGRGVENPAKFIFLVEWDSLDSHTAFRTHPSYPEFMQLFAPHAEGGVMEHFEMR